MDKVNLVIGIILLVVGFISIPGTYKNRKKINISRIYTAKDSDKYEVANEEKFLKLQNVKEISLVVICISVGTLGIWKGPEFFILCLISPISDFIFSRLCKEHLKLKE